MSSSATAKANAPPAPGPEGSGEGKQLPANAGRQAEGAIRPARPSGPSLLFAGMALAALGAIYWKTLYELVVRWEVDPNYSHGYIVPIVSLVIAIWAWVKHGPLLRKTVPKRWFYAGIALAAAGLLLHLPAWFFGRLFLDTATLVLVLIGLVCAAGGREGFRGNAFAAAFLLFAAPLPAAVYQPMAIISQQLVSVVSQQLLEVGGVAVHREGYLLHISGITMEVGEACSGLRQLTAIVALSVAIGYFSGRGAAYTTVLAFCAIPVAVAANCLRVTLTGYTMLWFGREFGEGVYHTLEGLVMVVVAAVMVVIVAWMLAQLGIGRSPRKEKGDQDAERSAEPAVAP